MNAYLQKNFPRKRLCFFYLYDGPFLQVGGAVREVTGYTAYYRHTISVEQGGEEGDCLHIRKGYHHVIEGFPNCVVADAVINFFMARTDKMQQVGFNPRLARQAHLGRFSKSSDLSSSLVPASVDFMTMFSSLAAEFFIDGLGSLHVGSCSDVIVDHASKIKLPWTETDAQKAYKNYRYTSTDVNKNLHDEVFYFRNRFKCMSSH